MENADQGLATMVKLSRKIVGSRIALLKNAKVRASNDEKTIYIAQNVARNLHNLGF